MTAAQATARTRHPVLVIGAGPAGCAVALLLADAGIRVTMIERHAAPHPLPRAVHLDDEVVRTLHQLGVSEAFLARSRPGSGLRLLDAQHRVMATFGRDPDLGASGFPQANMFHQPDLEELFHARIDAHPLIELHRSRELVGLDGVCDPWGAGPVHAHVRHVDTHEVETFDGSVVLGCDGANSSVRDLLGVPMQDLGFTERWLVVDVRTDRDLQTWDGVEQVCDPARAATFMQVTKDRYRWEFQLHDDEEETDLVGPERLGALLEPWTRSRSLDGLELTRSATYTFRARVAARFRVGRAFLLGDAAHLTPPFIGQGLAAGLRDGDNLAWKLTQVLTGSAEPTLLDTYEAERRPHAVALVKRAVLVGWAMTGGQDRAATVRRVLLAVACRTRAFERLLARPSSPRLRLSSAGVPGQWRSRRLPRWGTAGLAVGGLVPNPVVLLPDGHATRLDDVLAGRPAVLTARLPQRAFVEAARAEGLTVVRLLTTAAASSAAAAAEAAAGWCEVVVPDTSRHYLRGLFADSGPAVVVRPDRVVAALVPHAGLPQAPWATARRPVTSPA